MIFVGFYTLRSSQLAGTQFAADELERHLAIRGALVPRQHTSLILLTAHQVDGAMFDVASSKRDRRERAVCVRRR